MKKSEAIEQAGGMIHMYSSGYLDGYLHSYKNSNIKPADAWQTIRKSAQKAFDERFKKPTLKFLNKAKKLAKDKHGV